MPEGKPLLDVQYTGAPNARASFDKLIGLLRHTCLPEFAGTVDGNSICVAVTLSDVHTGAKWEDRGHPDEVEMRFNTWLKETYNLVPRIP